MPLIKQKLSSTSCSTLRLEESNEPGSESAAWQKVAELTKESLKTKALLDAYLLTGTKTYNITYKCYEFVIFACILILFACISACILILLACLLQLVC